MGNVISKIKIDSVEYSVHDDRVDEAAYKADLGNKVGYAEYTDNYLYLYESSLKENQIAKLLIDGGSSVYLTSIEVTTQPTTTFYVTGEVFDTAGMVVTATYSNGSSKTVTGYTYSPTTALTSSNTSITVSYAENGIAKETTISIQVFDSGGQVTITDWTSVKAMIAAGTAKAKFAVGTQIMSTYTDADGNSYEFPWDVVDYQTFRLQDGTAKNGMVLQSHYATIESLQYDAATNGYNRYTQSAIRQWLNSAEAKGNWWTAQSETTQQPYNLSSINGFLYGLDSTFQSGITAVKQNIIRYPENVSSVTETVCDKIFLPSVEQMYGAPNESGIEGDYFQYWKDATGLTEPNNSDNNGRIFYSLSDEASAQSCWLRSANPSSTGYASLVGGTGYIGFYAFTGTPIRCTPVCVIC